MNLKMQLISMLQRKRFIKWLNETEETFEFIDPFSCPVAKYVGNKFSEYGQVVVTRGYIKIYFHSKYKMDDLIINTPVFFHDFIMYYDGSFREYVKIAGNLNPISNRVKNCDGQYVLWIIKEMESSNDYK